MVSKANIKINTQIEKKAHVYIWQQQDKLLHL